MANNMYVLQAVAILMPLLSLNSAVAGPVISAEPAGIGLGLSDVLDINCSFSLDGTSNMTDLISVMLSRANGSGKGFTDLASIRQDSHLNLLTTEHVTAMGFFSSSNESFILLEWEQPTELQTGAYRCVAHTTDQYGRLIAQNDIVQVMGNRPTIDDWTAKVQEMSTALRSLEKRTAELEEQRKFSDTFMDHMTYNNSTYYVYKKYVFNTYEAAAICEKFGGYLLELNDADEYHALRLYLKSIPFSDGFYAAGTDERLEGTWVFPSTNQQFPSLSWADRDGGRRDNCLGLWREYDFKLADVRCSGYALSFVCEFDKP